MSFRHIRPIETGYYLAIIGDEDTVTGFLLAGIGQMEPDQTSNFLVVRQKTQKEDIEKAFQKFTERDDVAILLINQHIANMIRPLIEKFEKPLPAIVEVPSKDHPYKPEEDPVFKRVSSLLGMSS
jgi:V-type H+-transporting ATPase subunit F